MKTFFKTEFYRTFRLKIFYGLLAAQIVFSLALIHLYVNDGIKDGYTIFLLVMKDILSTMELMCPVFAGIHITQAFENRTLQAGVMAGHSRFSVLLAKLLSYCTVIGAIFISAVTTVGGAAFLLFDTAAIEGGIFIGIIVRAFVYMLTVIASEAICFVISAFIKNMGTAIAVNFFASMILMTAGQELAANERLAGIMHFTPVGQTYYLLTENSVGNMLTAAVTAIAFIAVLFAVTYIKFRKEELK